MQRGTSSEMSRSMSPVTTPPVAGAECLTIKDEVAMSKRELISRQLEHLPEQDLDRLLAFLRHLADAHAEGAMPTLAAETSLAKDWSTPEEDAAWAGL